LSPITEIIVVGGESYRVQGDSREVAALIIDASRGSLMEFAWLVEAETGQRVGINPEHVIALRTVGP
jgi:hypothetical protein